MLFDILLDMQQCNPLNRFLKNVSVYRVVTHCIFFILLISCNTSFGSNQKQQTIAADLFSQLEPSAIFDFTLPPNLKQTLIFDVQIDLKTEDIKKLASEFVWGGRWAKFYYPDPTVNRYQTKESFLLLINVMENHGVESINLLEFRKYALKEVRRLKREKKVGEFYVVHTIEKPFVGAKRTQTLSVEHQGVVDAFFKEESVVRTAPLTLREQTLLGSGVLTTVEIYELRALRIAT